MNLTARAWSKWTRKGERNVIDGEEVTKTNVTAIGGGLCIEVKTKPLSLSGEYVAQLRLDWHEIELLAALAAEISGVEREQLAVKEVARLKAEVERLERNVINHGRAGDI